LKTQGKQPKQRLRPADIATDEFIDAAVGVPAAQR
jgi:hypothetical protein